MGKIKGNKGSRPQCEKILPSHVKSDTWGKAAPKCKMPLLADGRCPEHGKNTSG